MNTHTHTHKYECIWWWWYVLNGKSKRNGRNFFKCELWDEKKHRHTHTFL
jgi:hypothetical protein